MRIPEWQITCANKNTQGIIVRIGGPGWSLGIHEAIVKLVSKQIQLKILVGNETFVVDVHGEGMDAYLVLQSDGRALHELDRLASC